MAVAASSDEAFAAPDLAMHGRRVKYEKIVTPSRLGTHRVAYPDDAAARSRAEGEQRAELYCERVRRTMHSLIPRGRAS